MIMALKVKHTDYTADLVVPVFSNEEVFMS